MTAFSRTALTRYGPLTVLMVIQALCMAVFMTDTMVDLLPISWQTMSNPENLAEIAATLGLTLGLLFELMVMVRLLQDRARMQQSLGVAAGALAEVMQQHFTTWGLTTAEKDIAAFTIKGFSITEIAGLRGSAEGTVKTHLNAIYRKSGVSGRAQLVSVLVEDLLQAPLLATSKVEASAALRLG